MGPECNRIGVLIRRWRGVALVRWWNRRPSPHSPHPPDTHINLSWLKTQKLIIERIYLNLTKARHKKPIANIILNTERLKACPLRSRTRQRCPISSLLFNIVLEVLVRAIKQEKEMWVIQIRKEEVKWPLFTHDIILYVENPKDSTKYS